MKEDGIFIMGGLVQIAMVHLCFIKNFKGSVIISQSLFLFFLIIYMIIYISLVKISRISHQKMNV